LQKYEQILILFAFQCEQIAQYYIIFGYPHKACRYSCFSSIMILFLKIVFDCQNSERRSTRI